MREPTCDLVWLTGLADEICDDLKGRALRLRRHSARPLCWIDGGGAHSWVANLTPGESHLLRLRPETSEEWKPWRGRRTDGAELENVSVRAGDRVLVFPLRWRSRIGDEETFDFLLELGGRHTNAILLSAHQLIVDVLRPVSRNVNRVREILPGRTYQPPPTLGRRRVDAPWQWEGAEEKTLGAFLTGGFLAMSDRWTAELCSRCALDTSLRVESLSREDRRRLEGTAREMLGAPVPHVVLDGEGRVVDHVAFSPARLPAGQARAVASFARAAELVWSDRRKSSGEGRGEEDQRARYGERRRRLERRRRHLEEDLKSAARAGELTRIADLITANLPNIRDGAQETTVTDWFDPTQPEVTIRLDAKRTPAHQAARLYKRARKLRGSIPHIEARIRQTEGELKKLERAASAAEADPQPGLDGTSGMRKNDVEKSRRERHDPRAAIRPRRYRTRDGGWLVLVGRSDAENDVLSLKVASPNDLWFHAHGSPGSHVILRREGRKDMPSKGALAEAAGVAAYWSKQRGASKVGVSYTQAKYVTKPKGAKPGTVTIRREKLLMVAPSLLPLADEQAGGSVEAER